MYLYESEEDNAACPICGLMCVDDDGVWICCDRCDQWFDIHCTDISSETLLEKYFVSYVGHEYLCISCDEVTKCAIYVMCT